jgi:hypothetical protein
MSADYDVEAEHPPWEGGAEEEVLAADYADDSGGSSGAPGGDAGFMAPAEPAPAKPPPPPPPVTEPSPPADAKVVYSGYLVLRVKRLLEAMDALTKIAEERGGYVDSLTERVIVLRVPRDDFEESMAACRKVGERLHERVSAHDVTEQYTDLNGRLAVAKEARERLLELLKEVTDVKQRLAILKEIKRLTEEIETIESKLKTLENLVAFSTITVELQPVLENQGVQVQQSPFEWIRELSAHAPSIFEGKDDISLPLPKGFVFFEDEDYFLAQAADTTIIRGGVVENEPKGDNRFWSRAVHHEMEGRAENLVEEAKANRLIYRLYKSEDVEPRFYLVAVYAAGDDLYVIEVFYPNEESKTSHHEKVVAALKKFEVKK